MLGGLTMSKFTQGKWEVRDDYSIEKPISPKVSEGIAIVFGLKVNPELTKANARLIAAAPEMYQHLKLILNGEFSSDDVEQLLARIDGEEEHHG